MFRNKLLDERIDWQIQQLNSEDIETNQSEVMCMYADTQMTTKECQSTN